MDYEKKYNEALERAKNLRKDAIDMGEDIRAKQCEIIFPELNESDDERIRKAILEGLIDCRDAPDLEWTNFGGIKIDDCIAWIEKQGEQKPIEWSEEDERIYCSILADIRTKQNVSTSTLESYYNEQISWLKSLKQRIGG